MIYDYGIPDFMPIRGLDDLREQLPSIFNNSLSDAQRLVAVINCVNRMGLIVGEIADNWADVEKWIKTNGVDDAVESLLNRWSEDGTLAKILDKTALKAINGNLENLRTEVKEMEDRVNSKMDGTLTEVNKKIGDAINNINSGNSAMWSNVMDLIKNKLNNGAISGTFANVAELKAKYPNGADGVYLTLNDKHLWFWDTTNKLWNDAGSYEPNPLTEDDKQQIGDYAYNFGELLSDVTFDKGTGSFTNTNKANTSLTTAVRNGVKAIHFQTTGSPAQWHGVNINPDLMSDKWKGTMFWLPSQLKFDFVSKVTTNIVITLHYQIGTDPMVNRIVKKFKALNDYNYHVTALIPQISQNVSNWSIDITSSDIVSQDFEIMKPSLKPLLNNDTNLDDSDDLIFGNNFNTGAIGQNIWAFGGTMDSVFVDGKNWLTFKGDGTSSFRGITFSFDMDNPLFNTIKYFGAEFSLRFISHSSDSVTKAGVVRPFIHYFTSDGLVLSTEGIHTQYYEDQEENIRFVVPNLRIYKGKDVTKITVDFGVHGDSVPLDNYFQIRNVHITSSSHRDSSLKNGDNLLEPIGLGIPELTFGTIPPRVQSLNGIPTYIVTDDNDTKYEPYFMKYISTKYDALQYYNSVFEADIRNRDTNDMFIKIWYLDDNHKIINGAPNKTVRLEKNVYPEGSFKHTSIKIAPFKCSFVQIGFASDGGKLNFFMNKTKWRILTSDGYTEATDTPSVTSGASNIKILNVDQPLDIIFNSTDKNVKKQSHATLVDNSVVKDLWIEFSIQGGSSVFYPKKNLKMKLYTDNTFTKKAKEQLVLGSPKRSKYNLKANYIDATQSLNIATADLVMQMSQNEGTENPEIVNWATSDVAKNAPFAGQIQGSPCILNAANKYVGLFTLNTGKDSTLFNMDDDNKNHFVLQGIDHTDATAFRSSNWGEKDFSVEQPDALDDGQKLAFTNLLDFVVNSSDEDFKAKISDYYNLNSLGRWLIMVLVFHLSDDYDKNIMHATYNGKTFNAILYDLDTSFGLKWDGSGIQDNILTTGLKYAGVKNNLFKRFLHAFYPQVREQYWNARKNVLSNSNIINTWNSIYREFPVLELEKDNNKWNSPSKDFMNQAQILHFVQQKMKFLDNEFRPETREDL